MSAQILNALDSVENKLTSFKTDQAEMRDRLMQLEQKPNSKLADFTKSKETLGDKFVKSFDANRELFEKTRSVRLEVKAAGDTITTTSGRTLIGGGVGSINGGVMGLQNVLPTRAASNTTATEYSRYTGQQGAAAQQAAEGDAKAAVRPDHSLIVQTALTIAGYAVMSKQAVSDSAELRRSVDITIRRSVGTALDAALVNGATGFAGGYETLATAYTSLVYTGLVDAISEGVSTMQVAGFSPDAVALNPADWLSIAVLKDSTGQYLSGAYLGAMPSEMRGLRVVLSPSVDAGKALLMDTAHSELMVADDFTVSVGYVNDQFTKNLVSILGELRVIPTFRTTGSMRLITPKA
jgi:HK97 family phage major capsid protein